MTQSHMMHSMNIYIYIVLIELISYLQPLCIARTSSHNMFLSVGLTWGLTWCVKGIHCGCLQSVGATDPPLNPSLLYETNGGDSVSRTSTAKSTVLFTSFHLFHIHPPLSIHPPKNQQFHPSYVRLLLTVTQVPGAKRRRWCGTCF